MSPQSRSPRPIYLTSPPARAKHSSFQIGSRSRPAETGYMEPVQRCGCSGALGWRGDGRETLFFFCSDISKKKLPNGTQMVAFNQKQPGQPSPCLPSPLRGTDWQTSCCPHIKRVGDMVKMSLTHKTLPVSRPSYMYDELLMRRPPALVANPSLVSASRQQFGPHGLIKPHSKPVEVRFAHRASGQPTTWDRTGPIFPM